MCSTYTSIVGCSEYHRGNQISDSSFKCIECTNNNLFFTSGYSCDKRVNNDPNCETFKKDEDICETCMEGFFIEEMKCEALP